MKKEFIIVGVLIVVFSTAIFVAGKMDSIPPADNGDEEIACTADALICPDGSAVGRVGPNCEFAPCPTQDETEEDGNEGILPYDSGISGVVMLGPQCPVVMDPPDPSCNDKPYETTVNVYRGGSLFASVPTDKKGEFDVSMPPGTYVLKPRGGEVFPSCAELEVLVSPGRIVTVTLSCDTGIR